MYDNKEVIDYLDKQIQEIDQKIMELTNPSTKVYENKVIKLVNTKISLRRIQHSLKTL